MAHRQADKEVESEEREDTPLEQPKYVGVQEPTPPSEEVQSRASLWLLKIASSHISDADSWVEEVTGVIKGLEWVSQTETLGDNSLLSIAQ